MEPVLYEFLFLLLRLLFEICKKLFKLFTEAIYQVILKKSKKKLWVKEKEMCEEFAMFLISLKKQNQEEKQLIIIYSV